MGCNISTHPRVLPQLPDIKIGKMKSLHSPSPTSASKTTSDSPHYEARPPSSGTSNPPSQNWSGVTFGQLDGPKEDYSWRNMRSSSLGLRLGSNGDFTKRRDSPEPSPVSEASPQKTSPFYSEQVPVINLPPESNGTTKQFDRFLTVRKKSEFFNEMMLNTKGLLKLNTCAEPVISLADNEQKAFPKSMDDLQICTNLIVVSDQEIRPGTPGFKPSSSRLSTQQVINLEEVDQNEEVSPSVHIAASLQIRQDNIKESKTVPHSPINSVFLFGEQEKKPEEKGRVSHQPFRQVDGNENHKVQLGKMFTQNLLDLVSPKKQKSEVTHKKTDSNAMPQVERHRRNSTEDDLSISLLSNNQVAYGRSSGELKDDKMIKPKRRSKIGPLGLTNIIGFLGNEEMISPINNAAKQENPGYVTPPFLNQTSFMKHIFGEGEGPEEKANFTKIDFEKYSFLADAKEPDHNSNISETAARPTKKAITHNKLPTRPLVSSMNA